ncbi:MAG: hypothetical protein HYS08_06765 [Chlamydiae bacterium]|nr:hypothetical protein [Chlamydiota bacterium]MBI3267054.1 hypothetical protein [Chlamydiota bacterium]
MKAELIDTIKKRYHRGWLLIVVDKMDESTTTPISGRVLSHSPHRDEVYHNLFSLRERRNILVEYSEDKLPQGDVAAFLEGL